MESSRTFFSARKPVPLWRIWLVPLLLLLLALLTLAGHGPRQVLAQEDYAIILALAAVATLFRKNPPAMFALLAITLVAGVFRVVGHHSNPILWLLLAHLFTPRVDRPA